MLRDKKTAIESLIGVHDAVNRIESMLLTIEETEETVNTGQDKLMERVVSEYNQLNFMLRKTLHSKFVQSISWVSTRFFLYDGVNQRLDLKLMNR